MADEMFFTENEKSLHRGKRVAPRTDTCRPCLIWLKDAPETEYLGVAMNVSPHGMLIRMMDPLPPGTAVMIQMMRDEQFRDPLAAPVEGMIVRNELEDEGFTDHGVQLLQQEIERRESRPVSLQRRRPLPKRQPPRMHTIDITVGDLGTRRGAK